MSPLLIPFDRLFQLNTRLFVNCFEGVSEEMARQRPVPQANSMAFIALHLVDARYYLARLLGEIDGSPFREMTEGVRSIDEMPHYPPHDVLLEAWRHTGPMLNRRMETVSDEALRAPSGAGFPGGDPSLLGAVAFVSQHDAYHIGQLAMLRKTLGLPAMKYT